MASFDLDERSDAQPFDSNGRPDSHSSGNCAQGLGLLVWLGKLARDDSTRRQTKSGAAEAFDPPRVLGRFQLESLLGAGA